MKSIPIGTSEDLKILLAGGEKLSAVINYSVSLA